jgi:Mor family transcriptional regulator
LETKFNDIARLIGDAAATQLIQSYAGTSIRIPAPMYIKENAIFQLIGEQLLLKIIHEIGHSFEVYVPQQRQVKLHERNRSIVTDYLNGESVANLAKRHQMSDRNVWRILKNTDMNSR